MTRFDEITNAANEIKATIERHGANLNVDDFRIGAEWADKHQWRACADVGTPPPGSSWVLGAFENGDIRIVRYSYACYMWLYMNNEEAPAPVYWMPIPELPK